MNHVLIQPIAVINNTPVLGCVRASDRSGNSPPGYVEAPEHVEPGYLFDYTTKEFAIVSVIAPDQAGPCRSKHDKSPA